jgi:predicted TIM-barrel enzyme
MAFNVGKFVKSAAKTVGNKMLGDLVSSVTSQLPMSTVSSAKSTAETLFNVGASFDSISAFAAKKTDSLVNQKAEVFYGLAGKDPSRVASADLKKLRSRAVEDVNQFINDINPSTKIAAKKKDASIIMDAVI